MFRETHCKSGNAAARDYFCSRTSRKFGAGRERVRSVCVRQARDCNVLLAGGADVKRKDDNGNNILMRA
jgi:hypothetical protein